MSGAFDRCGRTRSFMGERGIRRVATTECSEAFQGLACACRVGFWVVVREWSHECEALKGLATIGLSLRDKGFALELAFCDWGV